MNLLGRWLLLSAVAAASTNAGCILLYSEDSKGGAGGSGATGGLRRPAGLRRVVAEVELVVGPRAEVELVVGPRAGAEVTVGAEGDRAAINPAIAAPAAAADPTASVPW